MTDMFSSVLIKVMSQKIVSEQIKEYVYIYLMMKLIWLYRIMFSNHGINR
jgi:hypothetical protein